MDINNKLSSVLPVVQSSQIEKAKVANSQGAASSEQAKISNADTVTISDKAKELLLLEGKVTATLRNGGGNEPPIPPKNLN